MKKITIITVVKNGMPFIKECLNSFQTQSYKNKEHIIIVSKSNDGTENFLKNIKNKNVRIFYDHKKLSRYEAINFGIKKSSGEVIGLLHSDDLFYNRNILKIIIKYFNKHKCVYGNILYCKKKNKNKIVRIWKSSKFTKNKLKFGWSPPHTSIFINRSLMIKNLYNTKFSISADYDFILKIFSLNNIKPKHINKFITIMRYGGDSTKLKTIINKIFEDLSILKKYFGFYWLTFVFKIFRKIPQFF